MDLDRITELGLEKISRWRTLILVVSFSLWWNTTIIVQCYFMCLLVTFNLAFDFQSLYTLYARYICDIFYLFEVIFTLSYRINPNLRKLRYNKGRNWFFVVLDIISILPLEIVYYLHVIREGKTHQINSFFLQNRLLRIYRIFQLESYYGVTIRKTSQYVLLLFVQITSKTVLAAHFLTCVWIHLRHSVDCDPSKVDCYLWYETNMAILVIHNWSGNIDTFRAKWERLVVVVALFLGLILIYTHFYPKSLYVSMLLSYKRATYYERYGKLQLFLERMVKTTELRDKVVASFSDAWMKDSKKPDLENLLHNVPLSLQKEIFTDIYWDAFRHSEFLAGVSRSCKRSLSLFMETVYYQAGEVIYRKGDDKLMMMYLVQGIVQFMAEENEESPAVSFSSGTVFGELSLFLCTRSEAIVKCKSYCELQILSMQKVSRVLRDYPKDYKMVLKKLSMRLAMARYTQWRKMKFGKSELDVLAAESSLAAIQDCIKTIKKQWRAVWELHHRHLQIIKAHEEGLRLPSWHPNFYPEARIDFISNFLDLIVLSDEFEEKKDAVCLRTAMPWSIDPSAQFLRLWYYLIMVLALVPGLVYPMCTAWFTRFPWSIYIISYIVTWMFLVDVVLKLLTAIKTKHKIITNFSSILFWCLQKPTFYLDLAAALPCQIHLLVNVDVRKAPAYKVGLPLHPALLKMYVFFRLRVPSCSQMNLLTMLKDSLVYFLLVYWLAEFIQITWVWESGNWDRDIIDNFNATQAEMEIFRRAMDSIFHSLVIAISIPDYETDTDSNRILACFCCAKYFFFLIFSFILCDMWAAYTLKIFPQENFQVFIKRIKMFLRSIYIASVVEERLLRTVKFQWLYDKGDCISSKVSIIKSMPFDLRKRIYSDTAYKSLWACGMFQEESMEFIVDVMESSFLLAVPSGSVLVTFGHTSHTLSVIHRGYCQVDSFLRKDVSAGLSHSMVMGPCAMFPLLSSVTYAPSPVSVVTLTDCEVIMIDLNKLLNIMIKHNAFKDLVETVKEQGLMEKLEHAPGMIKLNVKRAPSAVKREIYRNTFRRLGPCGRCLSFLCPKEIKFVRTQFIKAWEVGYAAYLLLLCWLWPSCFGLLVYSSHIIVPVLTAGYGIMILHMVFQFFAPFYNKKGLLITHPLYTSVNYLTSTFLLDFICILPVYSVYLYTTADPYKKPNTILIFVNFAQHYVKLIHVLDFMNYLKDAFGNRRAGQVIKTMTILLLFFNMLFNMIMFFGADWIFGGPYKVVGFKIRDNYAPKNPNLIRNNSIIEYYMFAANWALSNLNTIDYHIHHPSGNQLYYTYLQSFVGTFLNYYAYAWLSSTAIFSMIGRTLYQEKILSLIEFLQNQKTDDRIIRYALSHYTDERSRSHGENLKKIFEYLPLHLHEELVYPLYRQTMLKNDVFAHADESFLKLLSIHVTNTYFTRGSVIFFEQEAQSDIFILHSGKCFVYDWFLTLNVGSVVGDIGRTGLMRNTVYALTQVEMLRIPSSDFFMILNFFEDLEFEFTRKAQNAENFFSTTSHRTGYQLRPVDSLDALNAFGLQKKDIGFEDESYFEDPGNVSSAVIKSWRYKKEEKMRFLIIYPGTWKSTVVLVLSLVTAIITLIVVPSLTSFGSLTREAFIFVGILDVLWLLVILLNFRTGYVDKVKGDVVTDSTFIAKEYAKRLNGFPLHLLALIPFELIPVFAAKGVAHADPAAVSWLRQIRLLRGVLLFALDEDTSNVSTSIFAKLLKPIFFLLFWLICLINIYVAMSTESSIVTARDPHRLTWDQVFAFILASEYVLNAVTSANVCVITPDSFLQVLFLNFIAFMTPFVKGLIINKILGFLYVRGLATSNYKAQVTTLEAYLQDKETSPTIIKEVLNYKFNILLYSRSELMPSLLSKAPVNLRVAIMNDLYMEHLTACPLFHGVEHFFLLQLVTRLSREIFFPGQKIVEQGDVDHRLYFIHTGEAYIMSTTKETAYVEYSAGRMVKGEYFGAAQGLWFSRPHTLSIRARTLVQTLILNSRDWMDLRRSFPEIATQILGNAKALRLI